MSRLLIVLSALTAWELITAAPAFAYVDPGSGSFMIQMIVAAIMGAGVTLKLYWHKIKDKLTGSKSTQDDDPDFDD